MPRLGLLILDVSLVGVGSLLALALRENFDLTRDRLLEFLPYFTATVAVAFLIFAIGGITRAIWRFSSQPEYLKITATLILVIIGAVLITFAYNRLDGVARSLPLIQCLVCVALLIGARVLHKIAHDGRQIRKASAGFLRHTDAEPVSTLLVVGISKLAETYLQAITELAPGRIVIAGVVGRTDRHVGRLVATHPVLGELRDIDDILNDLEVHGIAIDKIVVATSFDALTAVDRATLLTLERSRNITVQFLAEHLGLDLKPQATPYRPNCRSELSFEIPPLELREIGKRRYWKVKRAIDAIVAFAALVIFSPFIVIVAFVVAATVGFPVIFWQQRPGLGGTPFRLYKFRTMKAAHTFDGRRLSDDERLSSIGTLMRRVRMDEWPQLFNIMRGDMSIIGPRPLLPCDQSEAYRARLLVRPGLTGWAQVVGGRTISPEDKAALDVWYVRNASLRLDLEIAARTIPMVLFGERICIPAIERAWRDLSAGGVLKGTLAYKTENAL